MLTIKEVSETTGIGVSTVNLYCRNGQLPNAKKIESPIGSFWQIPATDLIYISHRKRGRPIKTRK